MAEWKGAGKNGTCTRKRERRRSVSTRLQAVGRAALYWREVASWLRMHRMARLNLVAREARFQKGAFVLLNVGSSPTEGAVCDGAYAQDHSSIGESPRLITGLLSVRTRLVLLARPGCYPYSRRKAQLMGESDPTIRVLVGS